MNTKTLVGILGITAVFAMNVRSQIYQLSTPISGSLTMGALDANGPPGSSGSFLLNFDSLSETIYFDPVGLTLRQVGTIAYTPTATNIQFEETQRGVSGNVTINLALSGGNLLSFDTGLQPLTNNGPSSYTFNATVFAQGLPMSGSYSLVTGGQTFNGSFSYTLMYFYSSGSAFTFNTLSIGGYPSSLQLSGLGYNAAQEGAAGLGNPTSSPNINVTATDGFEMELFAGTELLESYWFGELFKWSSSPVAAGVESGAVSIISQPQTVSVLYNSTPSFSVSVSGSLPLSYQWYVNGKNLPLATNAWLTLPFVSTNQAGTCTVVVTNAYGAVTSSPAILNVEFILTSVNGQPTVGTTSAVASAQVCLTGGYENGFIFYTLDGRTPTESSTLCLVSRICG